MKLRIKKENNDGMVRVESTGAVKEVLINEDIMHPDNESISVCFRGKNSSGIIDLNPTEIGMIYDTIKDRIPLIKQFKRLSGSGAKLL